MKIGIQNLPGPRGIERTLEEIALLPNRGEISAFELIFRDFSPSDLKSDFKKWLAREMVTRGIFFTIHAKQVDILKGAKEVEEIRNTVTFAQEVGAKIITLHLSRPGKGFAKTIATLANASVKLSIENTAYRDENGKLVMHSAQDINRVFRYLREISPANLENIGLTFDIGHTKWSPEGDPLKFLKKLNPAVPPFEIHLHGSRLEGKQERHIPLTEDAEIMSVFPETMRFFFSRWRFKGSLMLEYFPEKPENPGNLGREVTKVKRLIQDAIYPHPYLTPTT